MYPTKVRKEKGNAERLQLSKTCKCSIRFKDRLTQETNVGTICICNTSNKDSKMNITVKPQRQQINKYINNLLRAHHSSHIKKYKLHR